MEESFLSIGGFSGRANSDRVSGVSIRVYRGLQISRFVPTF